MFDGILHITTGKTVGFGWDSTYITTDKTEAFERYSTYYDTQDKRIINSLLIKYSRIWMTAKISKSRQSDLEGICHIKQTIQKQK